MTDVMTADVDNGRVEDGPAAELRGLRCNGPATCAASLSFEQRRNDRMFRRSAISLVGGSVFVAAVLVAGAVQSAHADAAPGDVLQPFAAHSGDACRMGVAKGTIVWHLPPGGRSVDGRANVVDQPLVGVPERECGEDGRYTALLVTARAGGEAVDRAMLTADNGEREGAFTLTARVSVEEIVVQVCRPSRAPGPPVLCGAAQTFRAPLTTTG
jgi:hypothetical protein